MKRHHWLLVGKILCFGFACLTGKGWAVDYILNAPGSTVTNGSGTTYVSGDTSNKPDISSGLADGDTITLTATSGGNENEYSISITGNGVNGITGASTNSGAASNQGNNTIILEAGSIIKAEIGNSINGIEVWGVTEDNNVIGIVGGNPDNTIIVSGDISASTNVGNGAAAINIHCNNLVNIDGHIVTSGKYATGVDAYWSLDNNNNEINLTGSISTEGEDAWGMAINNNSVVNISGKIETNGWSADGIIALDKNSIDISGEIKTSYSNGNVYSGTGVVVGNDNSVNLIGKIITENGSGISTSSNNNSIMSTGEIIVTAGSGDAGISVTGSDNSINISGGSITTNGELVYGIEAGSKSVINVAGDINTNGAYSSGIQGSDFNDYMSDIALSGEINTEGQRSSGIAMYNKNTLVISGKLTTKGLMAHGVKIYDDNDINITSTAVINTSGDSADGINGRNGNSIIMDGVINTTGNYYSPTHATASYPPPCGISVLDYNTINSSGDINVSGDGIDAVDLYGTSNVAFLSGHYTSSGLGGFGLITGNIADYGWMGNDKNHAESNTFHLLNGVSVSGGIHNRDSNGNDTSYLSFGYSKNGNNKAVLTIVDNSFDLVLSDSITSDSSGNWDGFFAGGSTTLNGMTNSFKRMFVGADSFDGTTVANGWKNDSADVDPSDGTDRIAATVDLNSVAGAVATLTIGNAVSSNGNVIVGSGSTYNLNGAHTHEFGNADNFKVLGTLNLGAGGSIVDYEGNDTVELVLGGKANNGAGATVGGTLNSEASDQEISLKVYTGADSSISIGAGKLTVNSSQTQTLDTLSIANGATGEVAVTNNAFSLSNFSNNGSVAFKIGKSASLVNGTGAAVDLSGSKGTLTLDLGDEADTAVYAKASGAFKSAGDSTAGNKIESIYGVNGVAGTTYAGVFNAALTDMNDVAFADGAILNSEDRYRKYTLINNAGNNPFDVMVENNNMMRATIEGMGGDATAAKAADFLVENEGSFSPSGQAFVQRFTALQGHDLLIASRQLAGEDATTGALQAGLQTVADAAGSVRNQMTSMRMGNISAGMASSFSSSGATAALDDISSASELVVAYEAGYTASSEPATYKQIEVWATGFGGFGEQGSVGSMTGWDFWNAGAMVGLDYAIGREFRIGGLFGYSYSKTTSYDTLGESIDNALRFGAYASYNYDNFFVDLSPTIGVHILESKRNLVTNNLAAEGERTALDFNINGTIGYNFNLPAEFVFTPSFSLGYTYYHDPDYTETGGGAGNLSIESFDSNSLLQDMGVKVGKLFRCSEKLAFLPEAWGGWEVEYFNTGGYRNSTTAAAIGSQSYSSSMSGMATNRGYFGTGLTALIGENVSVFGRYDHRLWNKGFNVRFSAGVKISF